jgi:hypothetical protein
LYLALVGEGGPTTATMAPSAFRTGNAIAAIVSTAVSANVSASSV